MHKTEQTVTINQKTVFYKIHHPERAQTIVAIHGFRGTHHGLQFIAEHLANYRIIIPDLPGFGTSEPLDSPHTLETFDIFIDEFIRSLNLSKPPIVLGHSFGSILASHYAAKHPQSIAKLILINPIAQQTASRTSPGYLLTLSYYKLGKLLPETLGKKLLQNLLVTDIMSFILTKSRDRSVRRRSYYQHRHYFSKFHNRQSLLESFRLSVSSSVHQNAHQITTPTLLIVGEKDIVAPLKTQVKLRETMSTGTLQVIPSVGHLIHYETPETAAAIINDFLQ